MSMDGLTAENRVEAKQRMNLYQQRKPYHESPNQ